MISAVDSAGAAQTAWESLSRARQLPRVALSQASTGALSSPQVRDRLVGVNEPQQAQEPNEDDLAEDGIAVDEEGNRTANDGSFDQIKNSHKTVFRSRPGRQTLCASLSDKAVANPSASPIITYASASAVACAVLRRLSQAAFWMQKSVLPSDFREPIPCLSLLSGRECLPLLAVEVARAPARSTQETC